MRQRVLMVMLMLFSATSAASHGKFNFFAKSEWANDSEIAGAGIEFIGKNPRTHFGFGVSASLSHAEVLTKSHYYEDFLTLDTGVKFGYFSDLFVYGEFGVDMFELVFKDARDDHHYHYYDDEGRYHEHYVSHNDELDAYVGVGIGIKLEHLEVSAFSRYRQIDARNWEVHDNVFSGVKVSLSFDTNKFNQ